MVTVAIGALVGWAFSGALIGLGLVTTAFGAIALGASLGSLFVSRDIGDYSSSPNYSFGPISNTMSQLVPIFVVYGKNRVAGNIIYQVFDSDKKEKQDLYVLVGEGGITSINDVMANDQNPAKLDGCSVTTYLDTDSTTHDSRDPSGARPYPDNVALICLTLKAQENLNGTPTITSIVEGMKVWTPGGFAYSRNPIWIILDILCHPRYGMGYGTVTNGVYQHPNWDKIDYACALAAANYCDATVEYGPRFQLDFVIDTQRPIRDILTDFLAVCRGYMVQTDKLEIYIDAPVSTYSRSITPGNIVEGSFTFWQAADADICNRITIDWIDPENSYERVTDVFQDSDDITVRGVVEKSVSLLGITRSGQVGHMGYYLLKSSLLVRNFCSFGVSFKDCDIQPGEVLTVSFQDFTGWVNKPFRVISVKDNGNDVMTVTCSEYIPEIYDDSVMEVPVHIDTSLTTNYKPDDVEDLAITEQLETLQDGSYNLIAKITWTPPESYQTLELWYRYSSEVAWVASGTLPKGSAEYYLPCTEKIGDTLYVKIYVVSRLGVRSDGQTTSKILRGDLTPPAAPTNLQGEGGFRLAHIKWTDPPDGDLDHIDVYRSFTADDAEDFTKIGIAPRFAQEYIDNGLGVLQTAWYKLKAVDVAGNESVFSDVVSATGESLPAQEIPDQSIRPSKFIPQLEALVEEVKAISAASIINSVNEDENRNTAAKATQDLETKVVEGLEAEATARTQLAAKVGENSAAIQITASAVATVDDKVEATYSIVMDANGRIAGVKLGSDGETSEMVFLANAFYFANPVDGGEPIQIFAIDATSGTPKLVMNGNLFVNAAKGAGGGWIVGNMISAAAQIQIGAGGSLIMGNGSIFQMGSGAVLIDSEAAVLQLKDPNNLTSGDYIRMELGDITTYKYINGAYRPMKSLRRIETGVASNGVTTELPGYWPSLPKIIVSPRTLQSYNAGAAAQSQQLVIYPDNIQRNSSGVVTFVPRAYIEIASGSGSVNSPAAAVNSSIRNATLPITLQTGAYSLPANAKNIAVVAKVYAQKYGYADYPGGVAVLKYRNLTATIYAVYNGTTYTVGTVSIAGNNQNISSEPVSLYYALNLTIPGGLASAANIYLYATVSDAGSYNSFSYNGVSADNSDYAWLKMESLSWSYNANTQLAAGSLNWVAISE